MCSQTGTEGAVYLAVLHRTLKDVARKFRLAGRLYEDVPEVGTHGQQLAYVNMLAQLPPRYRRCNVAKRMVKSLVFTSMEADA